MFPNLGTSALKWQLIKWHVHASKWLQITDHRDLHSLKWFWISNWTWYVSQQASRLIYSPFCPVSAWTDQDRRSFCSVWTLPTPSSCCQRWHLLVWFPLYLLLSKNHLESLKVLIAFIVPILAIPSLSVPIITLISILNPQLAICFFFGGASRWRWDVSYYSWRISRGCQETIRYVLHVDIHVPLFLIQVKEACFCLSFTHLDRDAKLIIILFGPMQSLPYIPQVISPQI